MKISELANHVFRLRVVGIVVFLIQTQTNPAYAYGGVGSLPDRALEQTAEQLILIDNPDATVTVLVQLEVDGPAEELTWLIPVPAEPSVQLASSVLFQRIRALTAPQHWVEVDDPCTLRGPDAGVDQGGLGAPPTGPPEHSPARVDIVEQHAIGPYEYTTLSIAQGLGDPEAAISGALAERGYAWSAEHSRKLAPYAQSGGHLLAVKLKKGVGRATIRPLAISFEADEITIPIRAAALSARADMPLRVWFFGLSHAVVANYNTLIVNDALFDWQSAQKFPLGTLPSNGAGSFGTIVPLPRNYDEVITRAANEARAGQGFLVEYSAPASHVRDIIWSDTDAANAERVREDSEDDSFKAISLALQAFADWDGLRAVIAANTQLPEGATLAELLAEPAAFSGKATLDRDRFLAQLESEVYGPVRDAAQLMRATPYMTQLFSTLSAEEMTLDPVFQYNYDLALVRNVHIAKQALICEPGTDPALAAWRIELPQGGAVAGTGLDDWPIASDAMPSNLKLVELTSQGSGAVIRDNSDAIGRALLEASGIHGSRSAVPNIPQNGASIGGDQTIVPQLRAGAHDRPRDRLLLVRRQGCSVALLPGSTKLGAWRVLWLGCALLFMARTRRRARQLAQGTRRMLLLTTVLAADSGCSEDAAVGGRRDLAPSLVTGELTPAELRDPESCKDCHPSHYREWSGSMHAFASRDPVFRAMNRRGQRETGGDLKDFCVNCHAPMAVRDNLTVDGLNLDELEHEDRGVTCYFCHSVIGVEGTHNAQLRIAADTTLRGPFDNALPTAAHRTQQSIHFDENAQESSEMCGACHDIIMPKGVAIERTFQEYEAALLSKSSPGIPRPFASCIGCHMQGRKDVVASVPGAQERIVHEHFWPGIDVALGDFPHREAMHSAIEACQLGSASISYFSLEVSPPNVFTFQIETNAGHNQPSGASQDRRMWLEFLAYDADGNLIPEASSGNIADGELEEKPEGDPKHDPQLILFGDRLFNERGERVHMFWDAAKSAAYPKGYESLALPASATTYIEGRHVIVKQLRAAGPDGLPARITARLRIRAIGIDVLDDLVHSGDLDPAIAAEMPTLNFGAQIEWTQAIGTGKPVYATVQNDCETYRCMLDSEDPQCR